MASKMGKIIILFLGYCFVFSQAQEDYSCTRECSLEIVETIPDGMPESNHKSTFTAWKELISAAQEKIEVASYYWTLRDNESPNPPHPTSSQGTEILELLKNASKPESGIKVKITKNIDGPSFPNHDIAELKAVGADVRDLNVTGLIGAGILHTKMMIVDRKHFYLGSANFDWRALTQVKEVGIYARNCPCIAEDMAKTFDVYWDLGENGSSVPDQWNSTFESPFNSSNPLSVVTSGDTLYETFVSSAPPQFCPNGRTTDLDAVYHLMDTAEKFIYIAVMDYFPLIMFNGPIRYWGDIDNYLRNAALRNVTVKLLMAKWTSTRASAKSFLTSLRSMTNSYPGVDVQVKMYVVPTSEDQATIPFARVNHNKYVVTEKSTHIGTSNWSGDYFIATGGVGFVVTPKNASSTTDIRQQMEDIFNRDWDSEYALTLEEAWGETTPPDCPSGQQGTSFFNFSHLITFLLMTFLFA